MHSRRPGAQPAWAEWVDVRRPQQAPVEQVGVVLRHLQQLLLAPVELAQQRDAPPVGVVQAPHQVGLCAQQAAQLLAQRHTLCLVQRRLVLLHQFVRMLVGQAERPPLLGQAQLTQARLADVAVARRCLAPVIARTGQAQTLVVQGLRQGAAQFGQIELRLGRAVQIVDLALARLGLLDGGAGDIVRLQHAGQFAGQFRLPGSRITHQRIGVGGARHQRLGIGQFLAGKGLAGVAQAPRQLGDLLLQRGNAPFGGVALGLRQFAPYLHRAQLFLAQGDAGQQGAAPACPGQRGRLRQRGAAGRLAGRRGVECLQVGARLGEFRLQGDRRLREGLDAAVERVVFAQRRLERPLRLGQGRTQVGHVGARWGCWQRRAALVAQGGNAPGCQRHAADQRLALRGLRGGVLQ